jgi:hypothetical protein
MATMRTAVEDADAAPSECWCCGMIQPPEQMVNLNNHPEVALCLRCAHFVHQRAWEVEDQSRTTYGAKARDAWRRLRRRGLERGWHNKRWVGRPLRAIARHLP